MFNIKKKQDHQYLYLVPVEDGLAKWELLDQQELDERVENGQLEEGAKLFRIEQEINVRFEKIIHLD